MKAGKVHRVPLTEASNLGRAERTGDYVFGGPRPLRANALAQCLKGRGTVHGFRSSFRDWFGEATSFAREVAEAALAHKPATPSSRLTGAATLWPSAGS